MMPLEPAKYTVGCVPYVNAVPLVAWFEELGDRSPVRVVYDVPSKLPARLESGEADAILVSSVDALRTPGRRMAEFVCIGSHGPVKSVRLFSKVPPAEIRTLALDASSMTSNRLARVILADRYQADPDVVTMSPDLDAMLAECDACVLIGDIGMTAEGTGLHVLDLGDEWRRLTGKPFVWAAWIGNDRLTPELALFLLTAANRGHVGRTLPTEGWRGQLARWALGRWLRDAEASTADFVAQRQREVVERAMRQSGWSEEMVRDYYLNVMVYTMDDPVLEGLREFQRRLLAHEFSDARHFPALVAAELPGLEEHRAEIEARGEEVPDWLRPSKGP